MSWEVNQDHENQMQTVHNDMDKTTSTMDIPEEKKQWWLIYRKHTINLRPISYPLKKTRLTWITSSLPQVDDIQVNLLFCHTK